MHDVAAGDGSPQKVRHDGASTILRLPAGLERMLGQSVAGQAASREGQRRFLVRRQGRWRFAALEIERATWQMHAQAESAGAAMIDARSGRPRRALSRQPDESYPWTPNARQKLLELRAESQKQALVNEPEQFWNLLDKVTTAAENVFVAPIDHRRRISMIPPPAKPSANLRVSEIQQLKEILSRPAIVKEFFLPLDSSRWDGERLTRGAANYAPARRH